MWRVLFGIDDGADPARQRATIERALGAIDPELVPRAPLLESVIGVPIPDTPLTASFDPKLRKASVEDLLSRCLVALADEPLVIVLEDCHWIDELSRDLLASLVRATTEAPVCFVLAYRPATEPGGGLGLERVAGFAEVVLAHLDADETGLIIRSKLAQLVGDDRPVPDALVDVISTRSEGNPFYIEELLNYLVSHGVDLADHRALAGLELPNSLQSLILGRIDQLDESPRRTLKVASVIGRVFEAPVLPRVYPDIGGLADVLDELDRLRSLDLVAPERSDVQSYLFRHVLIQTVAYESMPFALRSRLHRRVGEDLERDGPEAVERQLDLLAYHYWHCDDDARKRDYLWRAGTAAQERYANGAAIDYLERLVPLLDGAEQVRAGLALGRSLELTGAWQRAEEVDLQALERAVELDDDAARALAELALAEVARKQGRYDDATTRLDAAETVFRRLADDAGIGQVLHLAGTVAAQRGDYETARRRYRESLAIRERRDEKDPLARLLANLAIIAEYEGDFDESRRLNLEALEIRTELGDRWAIAMSQNNLGMIALHQRDFAEAATRFDESVRLGREVGDPWVLALGDENRGNARRGLGDYAAARAGYAAALRAFLILDDRWDIAFLLEYVAILASAEGEHERAVELVGAAERLREEIGAGRAPALAEELDATLTPSRDALGPKAVERALARGRQRRPRGSRGPGARLLRGRIGGSGRPTDPGAVRSGTATNTPVVFRSSTRTGTAVPYCARTCVPMPWTRGGGSRCPRRSPHDLFTTSRDRARTPRSQATPPGATTRSGRAADAADPPVPPDGRPGRPRGRPDPGRDDRRRRIGHGGIVGQRPGATAQGGHPHRHRHDGQHGRCDRAGEGRRAEHRHGGPERHDRRAGFAIRGRRFPRRSGRTRSRLRWSASR